MLDPSLCARGKNLNTLATRMKLLHNLPQVIAIQVGINFRSGDGLMPEHLLHGTQIGTAFDQVSGKRMTKRVRADGLLQTNGGG